MIKRTLLLGLLALGSAHPALASSAREMGQSEMRQIASSGKTAGLKATLISVSKALQASLLDARAYEAGDIYYRLVLKRANGEVVSVILHAASGRSIAPGSRIWREVTQAAMDGNAQAAMHPARAVQTDYSTQTP